MQTYPNRPFAGRVSQVRLQSQTTDNVVNYTAVVSVDNASGALLPGMTATLQFTTGSASDVLTVPSAALRFRPTQEALAGAGITGKRGPALWYLDAKGKLAVASVKPGLTDGSKTVVQGDSITEGRQVIVASIGSAPNAPSASSGASTNPLQPQGRGGGGPPGRF